MCEYSLHEVASRPAKVKDKLITIEFSSTHRFAAIMPPPGTELAFNDEVQYDRAFSLFGNARVNHKVARFRQIDVNDPHAQDALRYGTAITGCITIPSMLKLGTLTDRPSRASA
jgi:hypothetical protein